MRWSRCGPALGRDPAPAGRGACLCRLPEAAALAAANKRVGNILKKSDAVDAGSMWTRAAASNRPSRRWPPPWPSSRRGPTPAFERGDYTASLQALAALQAPRSTPSSTA
jgi:glycyl-tRNA synthetase beta chain